MYGHFEDLGGLLEALVERESRRALEQLPDTYDDLLAALTAYLEAVRTDPDTWRLVLMPQEGAPRLLHERIAAGRAAVIARLARRSTRHLPDPELPARMLSAYATGRPARAAGYDVERILEFTRWALAPLWTPQRELSAGAIDHRGLLAEREAQVGREVRSGGEDARRDRTTTERYGSSRANRWRRRRRRRWRSTCPAAWHGHPCRVSPAHRWSRLVS